MPFGHLRPLGTQRKPEGHIKEFDASLTSAFAFYEMTNERTPFMAKNFFPKSSEASDWDDIALEKYGDVPVEIYQRLPGEKIKRTVKNIGEVLGLYHGHDIFMKTTIPSEIESNGKPSSYSDEFYFSWLENSLTKNGTVAQIPLNPNHLNWKPSYLFPTLIQLTSQRP